eukprot:TRINITY_DN9552_c1_g1_i1.p1 TRINITY_DN9552_c1_g1~~TRINITY_DN9552_c1_g1_i1.p1  ORF type:complete len:560 (-),score=73.13 TRINITY_DN9552_c1_g1_i1:71-1750(-)
MEIDAGAGQVVEGVVGLVTDLQDGQMKEVEVEEGLKVLLIKEDGQFKAIGNRCTHYGAPLKNGALSHGQIRCPWHGGCFNTNTGDIEDFPGLDCLETFSVRIDGPNVLVKGKRDAIKSGRRTHNLASHCPSEDPRVFVIAGAGPSGLTCAETLRAEGFKGHIILYGKEALHPYDRTKLSKAMTSEHERIMLRPEAYFKEHNVDFRQGKSVTQVNVENKTVTVSDSTTQKYDALYIATGGDPRQLQVPGANLSGLFTLRNLPDAHAIIKASVDKNVVIVGSSFIGMEVASCIAAKAKSVTVVGMESVPFERVLGKEIGHALQALHEQKGVVVKMSHDVIEFRGDRSGGVSEVVIKSKAEGHQEPQSLPAEVVVIGAGAIPSTSLLKDAIDAGHIKAADDRSIISDEHLNAYDSVYVGGDIARFPYNGEKIRVEHWGVAQQHGSVAAKNMVKPQSASASAFVPFFWTSQFGKGIRYAGHASKFDNVVVDGDASKFTFVAYYVREGKIVAVATCNRDPVASAIASVWEEGRELPAPEELHGKENSYFLQLAAAGCSAGQQPK